MMCQTKNKECDGCYNCQSTTTFHDDCRSCRTDFALNLYNGYCSKCLYSILTFDNFLEFIYTETLEKSFHEWYYDIELYGDIDDKIAEFEEIYRTSSIIRKDEILSTIKNFIGEVIEKFSEFAINYGYAK